MPWEHSKEYSFIIMMIWPYTMCLSMLCLCFRYMHMACWMNILQIYLTGPLIRVHGALRWRHNERDCVSNHQPHYCLLKRLFGRRSKKISKLCVTGICEGNSPETGEFPAQRASNAEMFPFDDVIMVQWIRIIELYMIENSRPLGQNCILIYRQTVRCSIIIIQL